MVWLAGMELTDTGVRVGVVGEADEALYRWVLREPRRLICGTFLGPGDTGETAYEVGGDIWRMICAGGGGPSTFLRYGGVVSRRRNPLWRREVTGTLLTGDTGIGSTWCWRGEELLVCLFVEFSLSVCVRKSFIHNQ